VVPLPLQGPCVTRAAPVVGGGGELAVDGGADAAVNEQPDGHGEHCRATGGGGAGVPGQGRHGSAQHHGGQPYGTRYGHTPVSVVVHVAGCASQGAVIHVGEGWPEHGRREDVGAVDDGGGYQGRGDEQLGEDGHDALSGAPRSSAGMTPSCWNTASRLSSSQCSANSPSWTRQMSIDRISIGRPVAGIP
jgi:hypothetical protein